MTDLYLAQVELQDEVVILRNEFYNTARIRGAARAWVAAIVGPKKPVRRNLLSVLRQCRASRTGVGTDLLLTGAAPELIIAALFLLDQRLQLKGRN